jgi:ketosteroid isomerase-like protein
MRRFIFMGLAALVAVLMTFGSIAVSTAKAAPLKKPDTIDKTLLADLGNTKSTAEVLTASANYLAALQNGDSRAIAAFWTADGVFIDSLGQSHPARELITGEFSNLDSKQTLTTKTDKNIDLPKPGTIHWVTPSVALERGTTLQTEGDRYTEGDRHTEDDRAKAAKIHYLAVWIKRDKQWLLNYIQETAGILETSGQNHSSPGNLDELAWMVGQWITQGAGPVAQLSVSWSEDKKFLVQKFKVKRPGQKQIHGEQRIAWDPVRKAIRSWIFRADGGFAESSWSRKGDTWIVNIQGTNAGGAKISSIDLWAPADRDHCWFKSLRLSQDDSSTDGKEQDEVIMQFQKMKNED